MEIPNEKIKQIEDKIRDLINMISVMNNEDINGGDVNYVGDEAAKSITEKLREIAKMIGMTEIMK